MKTLSIQSTAFPSGEFKEWDNNTMPVHKFRELHTNQFNQWSEHIHNQLIKSRMWNKIVPKVKLSNTVRPGGVCYSEGQESFLNQVKEILR